MTAWSQYWFERSMYSWWFWKEQHHRAGSKLDSKAAGDSEHGIREAGSHVGVAGHNYRFPDNLQESVLFMLIQSVSWVRLQWLPTVRHKQSTPGVAWLSPRLRWFVVNLLGDSPSGRYSDSGQAFGLVNMIRLPVRSARASYLADIQIWYGQLEISHPLPPTLLLSSSPDWSNVGRAPAPSHERSLAGSGERSDATRPTLPTCIFPWIRQRDLEPAVHLEMESISLPLRDGIFSIQNVFELSLLVVQIRSPDILSPQFARYRIYKSEKVELNVEAEAYSRLEKDDEYKAVMRALV